MSESDAMSQIAVAVNRCTICDLTFSTSAETHRQTEFHRLNRATVGKRLTLEAYAKKKKVTLSQAKRQLSLAIPKEVHLETEMTQAKIPIAGHFNANQFEATKTVIKRTIQEHSHNNHHGLPGANSYAHRGPCSAPGQNNIFRGKKN